MPSVLAAAATAAAFQHRQLMGGGGPPGPPPVPGPTCLELGVPCGLTQGVVCDQFPSEVEWTVDEAAGFRYINSNSIPAFPVLDYCPFGIGGLYCGEYKSCPSGEWGQSGELCVPEGSGMVLDPNRPGADWGTVATAVDDCPQASWETMTCPQQGTETIGDCMDPSWRNWQFPLRPRPSSQEAGPKAYPGQGHGMGLDGVPIDGPTEAGGLTLEQANIVKDACNGHPTPGFASARYHYHMSPHCAWSDENTEGVPYTEIPGQHSPLLGWEFDGFGLYGHQDEGGSGHACTVSCADGNDDCTDDCEGGPMNSCHCKKGSWTGMDYCRTTGDVGTCENRPVTDECNGHFGPTRETEQLSYHYHVRLDPPYTLGCYGPSWQLCAELRGDRADDYCSELCETLVDDVCVQRGFEDRFDIGSVEFGPGYQSGQENPPGNPPSSLKEALKKKKNILH